MGFGSQCYPARAGKNFCRSKKKKTEKNQLKVLLCEKVQGAKYRKYNKKKYINDFSSSQFHRKYMNEFVRLGWQTEK